MTTRLGGNRCYRNLSSSAASGSTSRTSHLPRWSGLTILARAALPCPPVLAIPPLADAGLRRDVSGEPPHLFHWLRLRDGNAGRPWLLDPQQCHSRSEQRQVLHELIISFCCWLGSSIFQKACITGDTPVRNRSEEHTSE